MSALAATTPLLAVRGVRAAYGKIEALKGVDIDINAGEIVALIGANPVLFVRKPDGSPLARMPKDGFYFYQSQWTSKPMIHLMPHWNWPQDRVGQIIPVVAHTNCDTVELFVDQVLPRFA